MKTNNYTNESITQLKGAERVRKRPAVIFGSDDIEGCQHSIFEIISNSIDEAREGFGKRIEVTRHKDCSITVADFGRGVPVDYNAVEKKYNWELLYCELYAGGKYANAIGENYSFSLGINGLGLCATQYASEYMNVEVKRDGYLYKLRFEKGENVGGLHKEELENKSETGSKTTWLPDREVFTDVDVSLEYFALLLKRQAVINAGITMALFDEETETKYEFFYENGLEDYIRELSETPLTAPYKITQETKGRDRADWEEYKLKYEVIFAFSSSPIIEYYHNSSFLENGGAPDKAIRAAFTTSINAFIKSNNLYKKDEKNISFSDIEESLALISSSFSTVTSYESQTKKAITNKFIQDAMTAELKNRLTAYLIENREEANIIVSAVLTNKRSREQAEKARSAVKKKLSGSLDINNRIEKFVNCRSKNVKERELYIVEGDSALGSCKLGRDARFQAIMPVRGKILNCLKADLNKIFANEIITDLIRALGCGVEVEKKGKNEGFNIEELKWNRVVICTDADYDGFQIRTLILAMIYRLMPKLIELGKVFIAESPLYEITQGKKTLFAYSEQEKNKILTRLNKSKNKIKIQRSKGLGENEPEMMWQTTMNPASRRLIQITQQDAELTNKTFDVLLGDNITERKRLIEQKGHLYFEAL